MTGVAPVPMCALAVRGGRKRVVQRVGREVPWLFCLVWRRAGSSQLTNGTPFRQNTSLRCLLYFSVSDLGGSRQSDIFRPFGFNFRFISDLGCYILALPLQLSKPINAQVESYKNQSKPKFQTRPVTALWNFESNSGVPSIRNGPSLCRQIYVRPLRRRKVQLHILSSSSSSSFETETQNVG